MSGCTPSICTCDCHKAFGSIEAVVCNCKCWKTEVVITTTSGVETLALCVHGKPVKYGNCFLRAQEHKDNLDNSKRKYFTDYGLDGIDKCIGKCFERIENIESSLENHYQRYDVTINWIKERIENLENLNLMGIIKSQDGLITKLLNENRKVLERIDKLEKFHDEFKNVLKEDMEEYQEIHENIENRLVKLEKYKSLIDSLNNNRNDWVEPINRLFDEINKLEQSRDENSRSHKDIFDRIEKLEKQVIEMRGLSLHSTKPYKCPVCEGKPLCELRITPVVSGNDKLLIECHACDGKGIVWG